MNMNNQLLSLFPDSARIDRRGYLSIGGCSVDHLAAEYGTPLYVFDEDHIRNKCREFVSTFSFIYNHLKVAYASKAFLNLAMASIIHQENLFLDVVSAGELYIALSAGFAPDKIYFHGHNKSRQELDYAFENRIGYIVADNFFELDMIGSLSASTGHTPAVLIRINPEIDAHTHRHISTGHKGSKFGFSLQDAHRAVAKAKQSSCLKIAGFHCHLGSQLHQTGPYIEATQKLIGLAAQLKIESGFTLQELSLGGGFGVNYTLQDNALPLSCYAQDIVTALNQACMQYNLDHPVLTIEPGRAIIAQAGITLYRIGALKETSGQSRYVNIDGGMADNIRPALYDASYCAVVANKMLNPATAEVTIAGKYCESGDILIKNACLPPVEPGDILAVPVTGAYCLPMASNYNGALKPAIVLARNGTNQLIRRREEPADLLRLDINYRETV
jgi:diaminopimelate decarboxylase